MHVNEFDCGCPFTVSKIPNHHIIHLKYITILSIILPKGGKIKFKIKYEDYVETRKNVHMLSEKRQI